MKLRTLFYIFIATTLILIYAVWRYDSVVDWIDRYQISIFVYTTAWLFIFYLVDFFNRRNSNV